MSLIGKKHGTPLVICHHLKKFNVTYQTAFLSRDMKVFVLLKVCTEIVICTPSYETQKVNHANVHYVNGQSNDNVPTQDIII